MRLSQFHLRTEKETPADAEIISHKLMLKAGMIRKLASGLYTWLPMGLRIMRKAGYKMTACGENSDDFHKPPYATFEFHRTLFFDEKDFCPRFDGLWQRATRDPDHPHAFVMDVSDNYL